MHASSQALRIALAAAAMTGTAAFAPSVALRAPTTASLAAVRAPISAPMPLTLSRDAAPRGARLGGSRQGLSSGRGRGLLSLGMQEQVSEEDEYASAIKTTGIWVAAAAAFGVGIGATLGQASMVEFFTGYVLEESLSVDNLFVFILLFKYFKVPLEFQKRVLTYGIAGAIALRGTFITAGLVAIQQFRGVLLLFAGFLVYSSFKILTADGGDDDDDDLSENSVVKLGNKLIQSTDTYDKDNFFTMVDGVKRATPLLLVLFCVEISDILFAVDSIPAVFGVTQDPLIVFTSNIFAIAGLRSLYQVISKLVQNLEYLEPAVGLVLGFVGLKMIGEFAGLDVPAELSLGIVIALLSGGVGLSLFKKPEDGEEEA
ncbi:integral membrane protein TerC family-domain-containing protein [Baffinella frigidus]|nr:integral membrane protein TerC family-domain-containing protein [Cryptophyta sp. CCMP2293]|mmetsp:Transcript_31382/g.74568  ORF Transcript_31382/g.74568 Transcript_31382/m.74568 type:complete len:372 (-) Transcript_31382:58-1173(-)|eukprot:CAMPEP_0180154096 /NCGR_PEP_ID=MMETSP0986-20121125/23951_1 /TAXON_ID=697907 /ORGANISM="non described non described, Strain CCMP2293" /LENGTH=371 /DNA_ID=CAMNT_0022102377 /DNA_START=210 /DNA_END=1325 /DNA_ORIENTATION=-